MPAFFNNPSVRHIEIEELDTLQQKTGEETTGPFRLNVGDDGPGGPVLDIDEMITEILTFDEVRGLRAHLRLKMVSPGIRQESDLKRHANDYLVKIGKSRNGKIFRAGMGWIPDRQF